MINKKIIIILGVLILLALLLYRLNHRVILIEEENGIKVKYYTVVWPPHGGNKYHSLFYKEKKICPRLGWVGTKYYLWSPDFNSILYLHNLSLVEDRYEIYYLKENKTIIFSPSQMAPAGLEGKAEWFEDKIILWGWNGKQKDILDLKNKTVEVVKLGENDKKKEDDK
jgi:hypothetical protein